MLQWNTSTKVIIGVKFETLKYKSVKYSDLNLILFEMSGLEGSGNNLSVKTSPLFRTKYINLRNLPLTMSGGHSKIS